MKNIIYTAVICFIVSITAISCKKDTLPSSTSANTPNFVAVNWPPVPSTGQWLPDGYIFYDLNHDDNKDKKVFIARFPTLSDGSESMIITKGPFSIDSIADNWPASVKSAGFGYNTDMVTSAYMGMQAHGRDLLGRIHYYYDSLVAIKIANSGVGWGASFYEGGIGQTLLKGKTPQGNAVFKIPDGVGGILYKNVILYFKENSYVEMSGSGAQKSLNDLAPGAGDYDWVNVNSIMNNKNIWGFNTHYFLDFKNWRYFTWQEECADGGCLTIKLTMSGYKSLDALLNWPSGWGK